MVKVCKRCAKSQEISNFHKCSRQKDGYNYYCKECMRNANSVSYNTHGKKDQSEYRKQNKDYFNELARIWQNNAYKNDPIYRLKDILRTRFYIAIKKNKTLSVIELIGCNIEELKIYLEKLFKRGMTWKNYGKIWEIDHIIPLSKFDLTNIEEQHKAFHYTNLQPLFNTTQIAESFGYKEVIGNRNKSNKII